MKVALLTEIPAPFRIPLFNALAAREEIELEVVFLAGGQPNRLYRRHAAEWRFRSRVLPGIAPTIGGRWVALNAGVLGTVRRADLVVVGGWNQPAFWQAALAARALGRRLAVWIESTARDRRSGSRIAEAARGRLVRATDAAIVPGRASAEYAEALGAHRIVVAPNAVDTELFADAVDAARADREGLRRALGVDGCCFLAVGRLAPEKGFDTLLRAFRDVEGAELVLAGAGPEEARLRALGTARVRFLGQVDRDDLPRWYAAADCLVAPSRSEPWGFAISEAAVAGLPIVASDAAGAARDLVEDGGNGRLVPADDVEALAAALRQVAADPAFRSSAGARSRELAAPLTADAWADALAGLALDRGSHRGE